MRAELTRIPPTSIWGASNTGGPLRMVRVASALSLARNSAGLPTLLSNCREGRPRQRRTRRGLAVRRRLVAASKLSPPESRRAGGGGDKLARACFMIATRQFAASDRRQQVGAEQIPSFLAFHYVARAEPRCMEIGRAVVAQLACGGATRSVAEISPRD